MRGLSSHATGKYTPCTVINQKGEQTTNWDAKVKGKKNKYATHEDSTLKWCLNKNGQTENTKALKDLCIIGSNPELYWFVRP